MWAQGPLFPDTAGGREGGCRRGEWQVRGQGFGRGSAGAFALSLKEEEDRGRGGRQDGSGQASARAVSPHRALRGSGQAAGRTERATPQAPLPVLPSPGGRFLDPSAGLAGAQPAIAQRPGSADLRRRQWAEAASWGAVPRMEGPPSGRGHTRRVTDELSLGLMTSSGRGRAPPLPQTHLCPPHAASGHLPAPARASTDPRQGPDGKSAVPTAPQGPALVAPGGKPTPGAWP